MNKILGLFDRKLLTSTGISMRPTLNAYEIIWSSTFPRYIHLGDVVRTINPTNPRLGVAFHKRVMGVEGQSYTKRLFRDRVVVRINHQRPKVASR